MFSTLTTPKKDRQPLQNDAKQQAANLRLFDTFLIDLGMNVQALKKGFEALSVEPLQHVPPKSNRAKATGMQVVCVSAHFTQRTDL